VYGDRGGSSCLPSVRALDRTTVADRTRHSALRLKLIRASHSTPPHSPVKTMSSSMIDSEACFEQRVRELELEQCLPRLRELNWTTHGKFAFSSDFVPGAGDGGMFVRDVVVPALGRDDHPDKYALKRLFYDSYTLVVNEFRRKLERSSDEQPAAVPDAERERRRQRVQNRLGGLRVEGELEPSFYLQDLAFALFDANMVRYVPWDSCSKRDAELQGTKVMRQWRPDAQGVVRETATQEPGKADLKSDLLLSFALRRRGIALEMADVCSYDTHEQLCELLLGEYLRSPPHGYQKVTLEQLHRADAEVWRYLSLKCRTGVRRGPDGVRPLDTYLPLALVDPGVRMHLFPLPASSGGGGGGRGGAPPAGSDNSHKRRAESLAAENKRLKAQLASQSSGKGPSGKGPSKGKGRGKQARGDSNDQFRPKMPPGLIGKAYRGPSGENLCFAFNLPGGCSAAGAGGRCPKGAHLCAEPGCGQAHSMQDHS
jgi:hypothetical protein